MCQCNQTNEREETFTTRVGSLHKRIAAGMDGWMDGEGFVVERVEIRCSARRRSIEGGGKNEFRETDRRQCCWKRVERSGRMPTAGCGGLSCEGSAERAKPGSHPGLPQKAVEECVSI